MGYKSPMITIDSTRIIYFDVDETLLLWDWRKWNPKGDKIIDIGTPGSAGIHRIAALPHERHIVLLKQFRARGFTIVVWSQGGAQWAKAAVEALHLTDFVHLAISKPNWICDDLSAKHFMPDNIYLHPTDPDKDKEGR